MIIININVEQFFFILLNAIIILENIKKFFF